MFSSNQIPSWRKFLRMYSFCFCKIGISQDKTGGAVLSAEGADKTENSVPQVLLASQTSHSLFCFCFCRWQGLALQDVADQCQLMLKCQLILSFYSVLISVVRSSSKHNTIFFHY